ncbi:MAG: DNA-3-methyladenine glycosylase [Chitinophagaceae bacterium]|nr:DNA-3-methyladenine glycosylase [Chitinophagaceae bacterium]
MTKLDYKFYSRRNVVQIARNLPGKLLVTNVGGECTSGRIVETEAYGGVTDRASHAYGGRRTARTEVMYAKGGTGYVYLCYGVHHLFNVVTNAKDIPHAILIRAVEPVQGLEMMLQRTGKKQMDYTLTSGPGNLSKALGIDVRHTGIDLTGDTIFIADDGFSVHPGDIVTSSRIGVAYAGKDADLPYRFFLKGNKYVSGRKH